MQGVRQAHLLEEARAHVRPAVHVVRRAAWRRAVRKLPQDAIVAARGGCCSKGNRPRRRQVAQELHPGRIQQVGFGPHAEGVRVPRPDGGAPHREHRVAQRVVLATEKVQEQLRARRLPESRGLVPGEPLRDQVLEHVAGLRLAVVGEGHDAHAVAPCRVGPVLLLAVEQNCAPVKLDRA